jgi:hypothetical protein
VSATLARLDAFIGVWRARLNAGSADVRFEARLLAEPPGVQTACADAFVTSLGFQPIGGNWEMLDPEGDADVPRSASAALAQAFSRNMVLSREPWLGEASALAMAGDFLGCFDARSRQIVTNRMYFGWNPITPAAFEWAFVAFDDTAIALLLATDAD